MSFLEYITDKQIASKEAIASALQDAGGNEEKALGALGLSSSTLLNLKGEYYNLPVKSVNENDFSPATRLIQYVVPVHRKVFPRRVRRSERSRGSRCRRIRFRLK